MKTTKLISSGTQIIMMFFALVPFLNGVEPASAQMGRRSNICGSWNNNCQKPAPPSGGGRRGGTGSPRPSGPTSEQLQQQREEKMHDANDLAVEYFNKGDWANAIRYFQEAAQNSPDDPIILDNLSLARERQAQARAKTVHKPKKEARSAKAHGETAAKSKGIEDASSEARKVFDVGGKRVSSATNVVDLRDLGKPVDIPPAVEIPKELGNHRQIKKLQKERKALVKQIKKLGTKLESIRKKKASGKGNKGELDVQEAKTNQEISVTKSKIAVADVKMKSFVINLTKAKTPAKDPEKQK